MNVLNAIGNIGRDGEIRYTAGANPTPVLQFSFALQSGYGEKAVTTWLNCSLFGTRAETLAPMIKKGQRIGITGEIVNRAYQKDGVEKYSLECRLSNVTLLGAKDNASSNSDTPARENNAPQRTAGSFDDMEDSIPF